VPTAAELVTALPGARERRREVAEAMSRASRRSIDQRRPLVECHPPTLEQRERLRTGKEPPQSRAARIANVLQAPTVAATGVVLARSAATTNASLTRIAWPGPRVCAAVPKERVIGVPRLAVRSTQIALAVGAARPSVPAAISAASWVTRVTPHRTSASMTRTAAVAIACTIHKSPIGSVTPRSARVSPRDGPWLLPGVGSCAACARPTRLLRPSLRA